MPVVGFESLRLPPEAMGRVRAGSKTDLARPVVSPNSNYWLLLSNYSTNWGRKGNGLGEIVCEGIGICEFSC